MQIPIIFSVHSTIFSVTFSLSLSLFNILKHNEESWDFSDKNFVKMNVHAFTFDEALPNENYSRIGISLVMIKG